MATAKQKAAAKRNLVKARAAKAPHTGATRTASIAKRRARRNKEIDRRFGKGFSKKVNARRKQDPGFGFKRGVYSGGLPSSNTPSKIGRGWAYAGSQKTRKKVALGRR